MKEGFKPEVTRVQIYSTPDERKYTLRNGIKLPERSLNWAFQELRQCYEKYLKSQEAENLEEYEFKDGTTIQVYPINVVYGKKPWPRAKILDIQTPKTPPVLKRFLKRNLGLEVTLDSLCTHNFNLA